MVDVIVYASTAQNKSADFIVLPRDVQCYANKKSLSHNLFITNGCTGAISLICSLYKSKVKKIYVEEPTYFLMINIFKEFGFEIETIPMQFDGLDLDILEDKLKNDNNEVKMLYTIPSFHNPTSITMSHEKRKY